MQFRKFISIWALLALMLGQVALAQHSASHINHGFSQEVVASHDGHHDHEHNQDKEHKKHACPECLLTKSLQTAFYNAPATLAFVSQNVVLASPQEFPIITFSNYKAHPPRAPPAILI